MTRARRDALRRRLRQQRNSLSPWRRIRYETSLCQQVTRLAAQNGASRIAGYLACGGEADICAALTGLAAEGVAVYLPRIDATASTEPALQFVQWRRRTFMHRNRYGIAEPALGPACPADSLDIVFVPLTGIDRHGNRLGSGAGYYDRCFGFRQGNRRPPLLVGIAFPEQVVEQLPVDDWDVPMDYVLTPA